MPYIQRELQPQIICETPPKAVVIFGARQIGKTTLLSEILLHEKSVRWFNGDLNTDHRLLQFSSTTDVELTLRQADTIVIDEAQRFPNIGLILKQLVDVNIRLNLGKKNLCHRLILTRTCQGRQRKRCRPPCPQSYVAAFHLGNCCRQRLG